jgi:hypothetical protein
MPYKDAARRKAYAKKWNREFYLAHKASEYKRIKTRRNELRAWLDAYKLKLSCSVCGEKHPACLDFHHKDSKTKDFSLGIIGGWGYGKERLLNEISKCVVLCANCHRKEHFESRKNK